LIRVQRRVFAIGFFVVTIHGVLGLIGVAHVLVDQGRHGDAVALVFMSGVAAALVYLGVRAILAKPFWSPAWIVVALTPTAAAFVWVV
jgi:hypothetical protein